MKYILLSIILLVFSGCIIEKKPAITEYKISVKISEANAKSSKCRDKSLKVSQAFSSSSLMSLEMDYVQELNKVYSYGEARWQETPNKNITYKIYEQVRDSKFFKNVNISKSRSRSDLVLEIIIEDFLQYYTNEMKSSHVKAKVSLSIIDIKTSKTLASKTFESKVGTSTLDANGGVKALGTALSNILKQNNEWLGEVCK